VKVACTLAALLVVACSTSNGNTPDASVTCASPGGPVSGTADSHCGTTVQMTSQASCHVDAGAPVDSGPVDAAPGDAAAPTPFGVTMNNAEGDDDDCKYRVKWTATSVCQGKGGVTFTVTTTKKNDKSPAATASPYIEAFLTDTHPSASAGKATETSPGVYTIGPVVFDASGKWTVRFHFYGDCGDDPADSPHAHAAFFVQVP